MKFDIKAVEHNGVVKIDAVAWGKLEDYVSRLEVENAAHRLVSETAVRMFRDAQAIIAMATDKAAQASKI